MSIPKVLNRYWTDKNTLAVIPPTTRRFTCTIPHERYRSSHIYGLIDAYQLEWKEPPIPYREYYSLFNKANTDGPTKAEVATAIILREKGGIYLSRDIVVKKDIADLYKQYPNARLIVFKEDDGDISTRIIASSIQHPVWDLVLKQMNEGVKLHTALAKAVDELSQVMSDIVISDDLNAYTDGDEPQNIE